MMQTIHLTTTGLTSTALVAGPDESHDVPLALCLHGFPDNPQTWRHQMQALADAGYRVIAPTMRGYEPSSQPVDGDYSILAMARDVEAWLAQMTAKEIHLIGHDWGAVVGYLAGALFPEKLASLTTIAVPPPARMFDALRTSPHQMRKSWYMLFFQLKGVAEWQTKRNDWSLLRQLWRTWSPGYALSDDEWESLRETFAAPGVLNAMLQYYRQNASPDIALGRRPPYHQHTTVGVRTLAITGANDGCIDTRLYERCFSREDFPAGYQIQRIPNAGHFAQLEQPEAINELLLGWL